MTSLSAFESASSVTPAASLCYSATIPDGWQQGRGAFGGLVLATLLRAVEHAEGSPERRARSITGEICAPVLPGAARLEVAVLRRGRNVSFVDARLVQSDEVVAHANVVLGVARAAHVALVGEAPPAPLDWRAQEIVSIGPPMGPAFAQHYEFRVTGPLPFTRGERAVTEGFVCEREPCARYDAPRITGLLDAWWPALFTVLDRPRAMATVNFTAEFLVDPSTLEPDAVLRYRARSVASANGYVVEFRELWHGDRIVAMNQQTFALLT